MHPNNAGLRSELAFVLAFDQNTRARAVELCEEALRADRPMLGKKYTALENATQEGLDGYLRLLVLGE